ncbi:nucleolar transcription factor 1-B-like isoform X1 [Petromyzon marinus]|uniref:Nucleolar transcription factor 1-B-like isoform X1 n=1 Tax=Petromyzon marinus TaxID=7757 RepID=A0AAJ7SLV4_PETMA|nr:nucleolar transcription factor 1-B-like isoform X1 [Petromyzon marinus]XP_032801731.1 nucleolar transcription factor 1-B-like isoform X1 [Petromyzon marinus]XP_032801732.1 nucleolar transcription factor 1-B-like isoform X1 [Petromyzon marinus]XP_032801733.1 nucleolar transcription factor 1-B-like isoform X1 [Petromyzon marinus]XP_032801734.1 nucleolar transcription factor 1-B-like isoform X1 [Petromyzon marinus]
MNGDLQKKGEGVQTSGASTMASTDIWTQDDLTTLLDRMHALVPESDTLKFKTTELHFDWEKVKFGPYSGEVCREKWLKLTTEIRKYRTMTELLIDAREFVKNPYKGKKLKTHPDFPKKPLTPYFRFFVEKRSKYAKLYPDLSNLDLTRCMSKIYKELPEKKKQMKYIEEYQRELENFEKAMAKFREEHPELVDTGKKKSDHPEKPKTPHQLWYNHEKKIFMKQNTEMNQRDVKEALRKQWSLLPDKKRLKWIHKALELQKEYEGAVRNYMESHPEYVHDDNIKSVLSKAERQLKDKHDGRPSKPPPNGYALFCAELMVGLKDIPCTERMIECSRQWRSLPHKEKDSFQKRCELKKRQFEVEFQRFLESLPEEERERVVNEDKGKEGKLATSTASRSLVPKEEDGRDKKEAWKRGKTPETPKTAEEIFQQTKLVECLVKYKNDKKKALKALDAEWKGLDKKQKIFWIKAAAEDQKRYERELTTLRTTAAPPHNKKVKFEGEPKKPPVSGYQMFSQQLLSNGELARIDLKDRMVEIGRRWQKMSLAQKEKYKQMTEEAQRKYQVALDAWIKTLSSSERAAYKESIANKRKGGTKSSAPPAKMRITMPKADTSDSSDGEDDDSDEEEGDGTSGSDSDDSDEDGEEAEEEGEENQSSGSDSSTDDSDDSDSE